MVPEGHRDGAEVTSSGKLFQTLAPAIGKTRLYQYCISHSTVYETTRLES